MYCDTMSITMDTVEQFIQLAESWSMPQLQNKCQEFLWNSLRLENAVTLYLMSKNVHGLEELHRYVCTFIFTQKKAVVRTKAYKKLRKQIRAEIKQIQEPNVFIL